jgi:molybdopterin converting factor small subunit
MRNKTLEGSAMRNAEHDGARAAITVILPRALLDLFPEAEKQIELSAATVAEMVDILDARWPGMGDRLRDSTPRIRRHLNIFVDGVRATLETTLQAGGKVYILTAMSGG